MLKEMQLLIYVRPETHQNLLYKCSTLTGWERIDSNCHSFVLSTIHKQLINQKSYETRKYLGGENRPRCRFTIEGYGQQSKDQNSTAGEQRG